MPPESGKPLVSAPAEPTPVPHPHPHEPAPAAAPVSPGGTPAEAVPSAAVPSASVPTPPVLLVAPNRRSPPPRPRAGFRPKHHHPSVGHPTVGSRALTHPNHPSPTTALHAHPETAARHTNRETAGTPHQPGDGTPGSHPPHDGPGFDDPAHGHPPEVPAPSDLPPWRQAQLGLAESPEQLVRDLIEHGCPPDIAETALHGPYSGMSAQDILNRFWDPVKGTWDWPKANGFADGTWETTHSIPKEAWVDRIGEVSDQRGDFMGSVGDSYPQRSLAPGSSGDYNVFQGTGKQLPEGWELRYGKVGEAFGWPGGGTQWVVVDENGNIVLIDTLIRRGYLRRP